MSPLGVAMPVAALLALGSSARNDPSARQAGTAAASRATSLPILAHRARAGGARDADVHRALELMRRDGLSAGHAADVLEVFVAAAPAARQALSLPDLVGRALTGPPDDVVRRARTAMMAGGDTPASKEDPAPATPPAPAAPAQPRPPDTLGRPLSDTIRLRPSPPTGSDS